MAGSRLPATGDDRKVLEALAQKIKAALNSPRTPQYSIPQLSRELRATLADLRALPPAKEVSPVDELKARRKDRIAKADGPARPKGKARRRTGSD